MIFLKSWHVTTVAEEFPQSDLHVPKRLGRNSNDGEIICVYFQTVTMRKIKPLLGHGVFMGFAIFCCVSCFVLQSICWLNTARLIRNASNCLLLTALVWIITVKTARPTNEKQLNKNEIIKWMSCLEGAWRLLSGQKQKREEGRLVTLFVCLSQI